MARTSSSTASARRASPESSTASPTTPGRRFAHEGRPLQHRLHALAGPVQARRGDGRGRTGAREDPGAGGAVDHWDGGPPLNERLEDELGDLLAAIRFVAEENHLRIDRIIARERGKRDLFRTWHAAQSEPRRDPSILPVGALTDDELKLEIARTNSMWDELEVMRRAGVKVTGCGLLKERMDDLAEEKATRKSAKMAGAA
jgi:hypothetical protein